MTTAKHKAPAQLAHTAAPNKLAAWQRIALAVAAVALLALYTPLNHSGATTTILLGSWDLSIPVVPVFSLPYLLFLPIFAATFLYALIKNRDFTRLAVTLIIICACSDLVYLLFQTYVPRSPVVGQGFFEQLLGLVYGNDQPFNDFPSEHASFATVLALYVWSLRVKYWPVIVAFCLSVIAATVLIKQHSLLGALGGVVLAFTAWYGTTYVLGKNR